jgi:hypothetical protein
MAGLVLEAAGRPYRRAGFASFIAPFLRVDGVRCVICYRTRRRRADSQSSDGSSISLRIPFSSRSHVIPEASRSLITNRGFGGIGIG